MRPCRPQEIKANDTTSRPYVMTPYWDLGNTVGPAAAAGPAGPASQATELNERLNPGIARQGYGAATLFERALWSGRQQMRC